MKLYDFSKYAKLRDERKAAQAVASIAAEAHRAGSVVELKTSVNHWFDLHKEVLKQATGT